MGLCMCKLQLNYNMIPFVLVLPVMDCGIWSNKFWGNLMTSPDEKKYFLAILEKLQSQATSCLVVTWGSYGQMGNGVFVPPYPPTQELPFYKTPSRVLHTISRTIRAKTLLI